MNSKEYLDTYKKLDELTSKVVLYNAQICDSFPFLMPREYISDSPYITYDYSYTLYDKMPAPWRIAFGDEMFEHLAQQLKMNERINGYRIYDILEIDNRLQIIDNGLATDEWYEEILPKYQEKSRQIGLH